MSIPIIIDQESVSDTEFIVTEINYKSGDKVSIGDIILTYETSKAVIDVESTIDGFLVLTVVSGDKIKVGDKVAFIVDDARKVKDLLKEVSFEAKPATFKLGNISKNAQRLIDEHNIDPNLFSSLSIVKEKDVSSYLERLNNPKEIEPPKANDIIVVGARGGAKMIIDAVKSRNIYTVKYLLDDSVLNYNEVFGYEILGGSNMLEDLFEKGYRNVVLAFGTITHRNKRIELYESLRKKGWSFPNIIHSQAMVEVSVTMGVGNIILAGAIVGSEVNLGDFNFINTGSIISHECKIQNNVHMAPGSVLAGRVSVGNCSLIGMNATIYFDTNIGNNVTINNGLVINADVQNEKVVKI